MVRLLPLIRLLGFALLLSAVAPHEAGAQVTTPRTCSKSTFFDNGAGSASATQQMIPVTNDRYAGNEIFICGYAIASSSTVTVQFVMGSGTNCGTGTGNLTPAWRFTAPTAGGFYSIVDGQATWRGLEVPVGQSLCITWTGTGTPSVQAIVYYDNNPL